ncbi:amino acid adenylation domain-containing protein (plasmid) [Tolypothrix tenuis PCC 7101]|uniref:Amino acid adenylation domain-containing protein n=1 Tax=Tolypothrix tenuis PCC 7101 TaxID=231146 RepID=A0A1Z4NBI6_9CYAN|nr:amino acid adenylation domain-containing protein [Aulosira sp. FACHB-113]BAZ03056.1 amino acid adenylation domain-containing protein [Tolypothrix tenuis PCC 7101]BAZ78206.1 amino acid adenylation domain-containing protein [Aulosira laxa NIES-50]
MEVCVLPLSLAQRQIWYQEILNPGNIAYNIPIALLLVGQLDVIALEKSCRQIIHRHEILRTTFAIENGEPVQLIHCEQDFFLEQKILNLPIDNIYSILETEAQIPFNLVTGPLMRVVLYEISPQEHILLVNLHHIISDGWSLGIFVQELTEFYSAFVAGKKVALPELPIQYGDYAEWQLNWLKTQTIQQQLANWEKTLVAPLPILDLPLDKLRPATQTFNGAVLREPLSASLTAGLEALGKAEGATFFMVALAVYQVLLFRYSGQTDIIVGSAIANRQRSEIAHLIGCFINSLSLRGDLSGQPTFSEFLRRIRKTCVAAYANQDVPLELLVDQLQIQRDPSRAPIFQTLFVLQNAPIGEIQLPGLTATPIYIDNGGAKFDLSLMLEPSESGWQVALEYNTDLFTSETAQRLLTHYQQLLIHVVNNPDVSINALPMLTAQERQELLVLGGSKDTGEWEPTNLVELFIHTAYKYPDKIAISSAEEKLTYQELNERSQQLAAILQQKGVGRETRVGIFQERSAALIISLLAVLKAGGTYVPLDPQYPPERLSFIAEDSGISLILTTENLLSQLPVKLGEILVIDRIKLTADITVTTEIIPQQAAYIIYTSGSTGQPKGCLVTHHNVVRLMRSTEAWFEFSENDVWTLFHSFAFDFSVWEMWGALLYGGKLVVVPYLASRSPEAFRRLLQQESVTILNQTPSAFRQLIRADQEFADKLSLRAIIFGGEALELQSLKPWIEKYGDNSPRLINMYGITETTVHVTYRPIFKEDIEQNRGSVIGVQIPDLSIYILDDALEPTPVGVPGEIYVGGMGVSRGYLNRPTLTAQRFIPNPYSQQPGARLYRTGDLARRLSNGDIEYLGRRDLQVKVRGFRIELGEIEAALAALPQVAEATVIVYSQTSEDKRLVAYVVAKGQADKNELRTALKELLPDYMIPAAFMFIDAMPLTAQGKINRQALPVPDWNQASNKRSLTPPQTDAEKVICHVWEKVLGLDGIGIEDNFFDLGGDSILALKVVTEIRRQGWILTPKEIFQEQTVQRLARVAQMMYAPALAASKAVGEVLLTPIQKWFFDLHLPNPHHWNQAILLEVHKSLQPETVASAIQVISSHHDGFRLRFAQENASWRQFYTDKNAAFAWELIDLAAFTELEQNVAMQSAIERLQKSLNLYDGPLAGAMWFNLAEHRQPRLLIVIHHLIVDGVSWRILLQDLVEIINGNELSPPTSSFQQWSQFLYSFAHSSTIKTERQFWLETVKGETAKLPLDFSHSVTENLEASIKKVSRQLTKEQTHRFLIQANKAYRTQPQELLLAALAKTLSQISQNSTLQIMMEGHGREELSADLDITRTLGWFTTLYPLRLELASSNLEIENLIKTVKEQFRAVPRRGFGYGLLRYINQETLPTTGQVSFNYLGQVRNESAKNQLLCLVNEDIEPTRDAQGLRPHIIDINGIVVAGELRVDWLYSSNLHQETTIAAWAECFHNNLIEILSHCREIGVGGYTPSDFPLVRIEQANLDLLQAKYPNLEDIYPLSPLQEGMLFHTIYNSEDGIYFEQVTGNISGKVDIDNFNFAWQTVVERHPTLRSAFIWDNQDQPLQIVSKNVDFYILQQDWRNLSATQQKDKLPEYLISDRQTGFDLSQPTLMRFVMIRLDDSTWQWVWSHHHIILDGWSLPIIFKEVLTIYQSTCQQVPHSLPPIPPYRHYVQWLKARNIHEAQEFWQSTLAEISTPIRLSWQLETSELATNLSAYAEAELRLNAAEFAQLQKMAQSQRLTLNTIAQGAWALCLQKHGAGEDVVFGVTVSGRPPELAEVENMVGLFINTLPMRVRLNASVTVASWLENIQQHHVQMREYEYSKLTDIQKQIPLAAGESLFESILVFENYPVDKSLKEQRQDFQVDDIEFYERTNYPLTVGVIPDDGLLLKLNYQTQFLSATAANILLERLRNIMVNLAQHPHEVLGAIQALSEQECDRIIHTAKGNVINWGDFRTAHQLFEVQADLHPQAVALVADDKTITYGELEQRANQLAATLINAGIRYESIVGLYFDPSIDYIIALLAVLKAGAAFLPLDRSYPKARSQFMVENSQTAVILSNETPPSGLFAEDVRVILLKDEKESFLQVVTRPNLKIRPENLAYIIYTSGSTGKPKGVLVTHAGIQNLVQAQTESFGVTDASRVYQFASLNFDAAISEIFMALGSGASLYLQDAANRTSSPALWAKLTAANITHITLPPSLVAAIAPTDLPQLQTLIMAGEAASLDLFRRWGTENRSCFNAYGPTEATVCASLMNCTQLLGEPSIGQAIANVEIYLLDSFLQPVAPGVTGEIYIGGISLARGYLHRADLTAAAFIPHPFASQPGARLYKTGDRGVYDLQGNIRFLGRQDSQVKLNGYRIELGEIEAALIKYPKVDSAVVMVRQDLPGRKRLIAYALIPTENSPGSNELRDYLTTVLPAYMVPSGVVLLTAWPLTPNGKIDRQALPAPELITTPAIPKTETEEIFAQIWVEVLGLETVNPQDNFFELGGDSIISLQIVSRARAAGWEISPKDIFEAQTLSRIAARAKPLQQQLAVIEPLTGVVPLSPIQNWFFAQKFPHPHHWNQAVALSIDESLNIEALNLALQSLVQHHDVFRLTFIENLGEWEQSYTESINLDLQIADFSNHLPDTQSEAFAAIVGAQHGSFQLKRSPLLRVLYATNLAEYGNVLILFAHHLVVDGVSWRILLADLNQAYQQAIAQQPISLPPKTSSYRRWTTSLQNLANSTEIIQDIPFWQNILSTPVATLPVDYPVNPDSNTVDSSAVISYQLTPAETNFLLKQATTNYHASVQEIMLAALLKTLTEAYESDAWLIDLEGHGREEIIEKLDLSRTVGWFTSLYPILLKQPTLNAEPDLLLKEIKTQIRTIPHHGISFGILRYLRQEATLINAQKPDISFNYLGQTDSIGKNNGLFNISNVPLGTGLFAQQQRPHILEINARIQNEQLEIDWSYSRNIHYQESIQAIAESYQRNLRFYLTDFTSTNVAFYSASDFNLVDLSETELDAILDDLE